MTTKSEVYYVYCPLGDINFFAEKIERKLVHTGSNLMALVLALAPRLGSKSAKTESIIWCHLGSQTKACQGYYQIHNDIATFVQFSCLLHEFYSSISKAVNIMIQCTLQPTHYMQHHYTRLEYVVSWRCLQVTY